MTEKPSERAAEIVERTVINRIITTQIGARIAAHEILTALIRAGYTQLAEDK